MLPNVAVVVPCYRVRRHILGVLAGLRGRVAAVYVVDDACPDQTGRFVRAMCNDPAVTVLFHTENQGVGGAVLTGYARALADGHQIVVKMDGDGQMDPAYLAALVAPVLSGAADYAKGDRFCGWRSLRAMPPLRVLGNLAASLLMRAAGRWRGMDPCNGYTAIARDTLAQLPFEQLERRWFFESDMLCWLSGIGAQVQRVPIPALYGDEVSGLNTALVLREFPLRLAARALRRLPWHPHPPPLSRAGATGVIRRFCRAGPEESVMAGLVPATHASPPALHFGTEDPLGTAWVRGTSQRMTALFAAR